MLILTRNIGESINVGDEIIFKVLGFTSNGEVRVGIEAPANIPIYRTEVAHKFPHNQEKPNG